MKEGIKMKRLKEVWLVILGFVLGIVLIVGCAASIEEETLPPQKEEPPKEIVQVEEKPEIKQEQNEQTAEDCDDIRNELEALQVKYEALRSENSELNAKYNTLSADYDAFNSEYNALLEGTPDITESELEQAIFARINKGRQDNGVSELEWTDSFHMWAEEHSNYLANNHIIGNADQPYMQGVFRATGYSSLDRIINAAWKVWENSTVFERNFLNQQAKYGTVAVSKSQGIYYITYFADVQK